MSVNIKKTKKEPVNTNPVEGVGAGQMAGELKLISPHDLTPWKANAKTHPKAQVEKIAQQIQEFGWDQPIVVDEKMVILKGHGRRLAAIDLGLEAVPVVIRTGLNAAEKRAIRLADNKIAETPWDQDKLRKEISALQKLDRKTPKFDFDLSGFTAPDVAKLFPDAKPPIPKTKSKNKIRYECPECGHQWESE